MKERGILFNTEMVRAILDGRKTQTRRVIKPQPNLVFKNNAILYTPQDEELGRLGKVLNCKYGAVGDRLWVRENFVLSNQGTPIYSADFMDKNGGYWNSIAADPKGVKWIPSLHMSRQQSRITLEITDVRVERLQDISRGDCVCEGFRVDDVTKRGLDPIFWFAQLWEEIYGAGSWAKNEWVWVIEFKRIEV